MIVLFVGVELFARFYLGLGDPPLYEADPKIEYLQKPFGSYHRFGNAITINEWSMRSGPLTKSKQSPDERRVLLIGDSIVNGGALTDDKELASAILQQRLTDAMKRDVFVGNISAGSWGPENMLAYTRRFGWFDADVVAIVFNSEDYMDAPTYTPQVGVEDALPDHAPLLAIQEAVTRYLWPRIFPPPAKTQVPVKQENIDSSLNGLKMLIAEAKSAGVKRVIIALHPKQSEMNKPEVPGHAALAATIRACGLEPLELEASFKKQLETGPTPYRDDIHPNALGQRVLADALYSEIYESLADSPATTKTAN